MSCPLNPTLLHLANHLRSKCRRCFFLLSLYPVAQLGYAVFGKNSELLPEEVQCLNCNSCMDFWPGTRYVNQPRFKLRGLPVSASRVLNKRRAPPCPHFPSFQSISSFCRTTTLRMNGFPLKAAMAPTGSCLHP